MDAPRSPSNAEGFSASNELLHGLHRLAQALRSHAQNQRGADGLTPTQQQVLCHLASRGPCRAGDLAAHLGVSRASTSDTLNALEAKGLVTRRSAPEDGRGVLLRLTPKGRRRARSLQLWPDLMVEALDELNDSERAAMLRAVIAMIRRLVRDGRIPPARMCVTCAYFRPNLHDDPRAPHHCAFVDEPLPEAELRLDCPDHVPA